MTLTYEETLQEQRLHEEAGPEIVAMMMSLDLTNEQKAELLALRELANESDSRSRALFDGITDQHTLATITGFMAGQYQIVANEHSRFSMECTARHEVSQETISKEAAVRQAMLAKFIGDRFLNYEGAHYKTPTQRAQYAQFWIDSVEEWASTLRATRNAAICESLSASTPVKHLARILGVSRAYINKVRVE